MQVCADDAPSDRLPQETNDQPTFFMCLHSHTLQQRARKLLGTVYKPMCPLCLTGSGLMCYKCKFTLQTPTIKLIVSDLGNCS